MSFAFADDPRLTIISALATGVPTVPCARTIVLPTTVSVEVETERMFAAVRFPVTVKLPVILESPTTSSVKLGLDWLIPRREVSCLQNKLFA